MDARERFDELCDDLAAQNPEVTLTHMMGMPAVKADGKLVWVFIRAQGAMVFKLPDAGTHAEALGLDGAHLFDPSGEGRPFKQWVVVPEAHSSAWADLAQRAFDQRLT